MRLSLAILSVLCLAGPALTQVQPSTTQPKPAQHQPGVAAPSGHAPGQSVSPPPAEAPEKIDPAKEAAIRHLMDITNTAKLGDNLATYLTGQVHDVVSRALTPENLPKFMASFTQKFSATAPGAAVTDMIVPIYAKAFSMEDVQGLIQFYESPLGQKVVKVLPDVEQKSQMAGIQIEQAAALKVLRGMASEYPELKQILPPENAPSTPGGAGAGTGTSVPPPKPEPTTPSK
jgi:uncharacterized protein